MGISQPRKKGRPRKPEKAAKRLKVTVEPIQPMAALCLHFGSRLQEIGAAFRLDGRPTSFFELMKRMNGERKDAGQEQIRAREPSRMKRWFRYRGTYLTRVQFARIVEKRRQERGDR